MYNLSFPCLIWISLFEERLSYISNNIRSKCHHELTRLDMGLVTGGDDLDPDVGGVCAGWGGSWYG